MKIPMYWKFYLGMPGLFTAGTYVNSNILLSGLIAVASVALLVMQFNELKGQIK